MSNETNILDNVKIQGDITSCRIETLKLSIEKKGIFSPTQKVTYQNYDVCTKNVINSYVVPEINPGFIGLLFIIILVGCVLTCVITAILDNI